jgi:hypothetical protein
LELFLSIFESIKTFLFSTNTQRKAGKLAAGERQASTRSVSDGGLETRCTVTYLLYTILRISLISELPDGHDRAMVQPLAWLQLKNTSSSL